MDESINFRPVKYNPLKVPLRIIHTFSTMPLPCSSRGLTALGSRYSNSVTIGDIEWPLADTARTLWAYGRVTRPTGDTNR